jgi:hypothetical protein
MKKLTALVLTSFLAAMSMRADVIWQDTFNYSNGPVSITSTNGTGSTTVSNWITHSGNLDSFVNKHRLEVSTSPARSGDVNRQFSMTNGSPYTNVQQVIYASFIINFTNLPTAAGTYFAHFHSGVPSSSSFEGKLYALVGFPANSGATATNFVALPNTFRLGVAAAASDKPSKVFPIDLALNTDYQVVLGWDPVTDDSLTLWINPISSSDVNVESSDAFTPSATLLANSLAFRQATGFGGFLTVSNVVVATTFAEAATNVMGTNAVTPKIVYQPAGITNFVGSSVTLSAVAAGQGQASLTYQWQTNGVNISNPAGNTNVYSIGSAQTTDSGNYTLIVTTPYGLSVTSSVAKVLISNAPIPPAFITQPVSQTVYRGQTVIFSSTVSSPGTATFTWYSNNVVVTAGTQTTGDSSTLELDNVTTSFSASYRVGVTNNVVANGILSSNAVLTVLNPQVVTIAYLRTLVDPLNGYAPTNNPPTIPYQVTGIVTTFTNVTTGNTSSYFLQDATAGINIFATFGSTFRPALGDVVTYVGVLSSFTTGLELYADTTTRLYTSYTILSNNIAGLPTPISIPFDVTTNLNNVNYNIAGSLVILHDVYFGTNSGLVLSTTANNTITVTNGSGQSFNLSFFDLDLNTAGQTLPSYAYSVSGVMYGINTNFSVAVTRFADIVTTVPLPGPLNLSFSGGNITFSWSDPSFSLQSSTNVAGPYTTIFGASSGFMTNTTSAPTMFFRLYHP